MTDTVQVAIIASIPPTIVGVLNYMQQRQVKSAVRLVKSQTDGIKDALVTSTKLASHAEGVRDEKIRIIHRLPTQGRASVRMFLTVS